MEQLGDGIKGELKNLATASLLFNASHLDFLFRYCYKKSFFFIKNKKKKLCFRCGCHADVLVLKSGNR